MVNRIIDGIKGRIKQIQHLMIVGFLLFPVWAEAHVKWFSNFRYDQPPATFADLNHISFWGLLTLSFVTLALIVFVDHKLKQWPKYVQFDRYLESYSGRATIILRIFTAASLLLAWQVDSMIAPELKITAGWQGWFQFGLILLLLFQRTTPIAGGGMILFYLVGILNYGFFHMLDYMVYPAVGYFLLVSNSDSKAIFGSRIPAIYAGLGFSLCWAALEKIFYPNWGLEVLSQAPALTMGLNHEFFLLSCAFVELCLGYLLIIGLLQRPLALTITLVFFTTTAFFGKTEIVGHTLLHGALFVFVVIGTGHTFKPPIAFHRNLGLRMAFASVNFIVVLGLLGSAYHYLSQRTFEAGGLKKPQEAIIQKSHEDHSH